MRSKDGYTAVYGNADGAPKMRSCVWCVCRCAHPAWFHPYFRSIQDHANGYRAGHCPKCLAEAVNPGVGSCSAAERREIHAFGRRGKHTHRRLDFKRQNRFRRRAGGKLPERVRPAALETSSESLPCCRVLEQRGQKAGLKVDRRPWCSGSCRSRSGSTALSPSSSSRAPVAAAAASQIRPACWGTSSTLW